MIKGMKSNIKMALFIVTLICGTIFSMLSIKNDAASQDDEQKVYGDPHATIGTNVDKAGPHQEIKAWIEAWENCGDEKPAAKFNPGPPIFMKWEDIEINAKCTYRRGEEEITFDAEEKTVEYDPDAEIKYEVTIKGIPSEGGSTSPKSGWYPEHSKIRCQAYPKEGWKTDDGVTERFIEDLCADTEKLFKFIEKQ